MRTVFFDVDTQIDFLFPAGALYVPGAEFIIPNIAKLNSYAMKNGIALVSTVDAHTENDAEFAAWPPHCVVGTVGQQKPAATLVGQMLLEKQSVDCFTVPTLPALLESLNAVRYVVYGVVTEICVWNAARGLLRTGKPVELVTDAVKSLSDDAAAKMLAEFTAAGGTLTTVSEICK
jgi:nicotinamidase/pyrazinamidase